MLRTMLRPAFQRVGAAAAARVSMHTAQRLTMQRLAVGGAVASVAFTLAQQAVAECKAPPADWHAVKSQLQVAPNTLKRRARYRLRRIFAVETSRVRFSKSGDTIARVHLMVSHRQHPADVVHLHLLVYHRL
eukprot:6193117-Pleurochrysis_carterae.AAC.3